MMAWVTFVRSQIDRAIDVHWQISIHLDHTAIISLEPVVAAPRFIRDVFDAEIFAGRQLDMRERTFATRLDRELKHSVQLVFGNYERSPPILVPLQERPFTWKFRLEFGEDFLEMRIGKRRCNGVIKGLRFFIKLQTFALQHSYSCLERG